MKEFDAVSYFNTEDYEAVISKLQDMDFKIFYIDGKDVSTMQEFFNFIKDTLPLDPPLTGVVNFDAFNDSVSAGIGLSEYKKVAIVYKNSEKFIKQDRFDVFESCMKSMADDLMHEEFFGGKTTMLKTFLFGKSKKAYSL